MDSLPDLDWTAISPYVVLAIFIIWNKWDDIKSAVSGMFRQRSQEAADQREHQQTIEEMKYEVWAQQQATTESRQREMDNQAMAILREMLSWSREDLSKMQAKMETVHFVINRQNDLITLVNQNLSELNDRVQERHEEN